MANQHTKKAQSTAKKTVGKAAVKAQAPAINNVADILADFKSRLGKNVEYHWYNSEVLPLQQRFDGGEDSESLTNAVLALKHP
jgi:hypothetical protein